jgi:hypothetical protein
MTVVETCKTSCVNRVHVSYNITRIIPSRLCPPGKTLVERSAGLVIPLSWAVTISPMLRLPHERHDSKWNCSSSSASTLALTYFG